MTGHCIFIFRGLFVVLCEAFLYADFSSERNEQSFLPEVYDSLLLQCPQHDPARQQRTEHISSFQG